MNPSTLTHDLPEHEQNEEDRYTDICGEEIFGELVVAK
jgi:hypothetical protein